MDLIKEYYLDKGYDYDLNKKYQSKHKKIVSWQKKFKTKTNNLATTKKLSKLKLRISKTSLHHKSSIATLDSQCDYSKIYNDAVLSFTSRADEEVSSWREHTSSELHKSAGPIEKFNFFEEKIRKSVHHSYAKYFPDSTDVLEDVLNLMFQRADNTFTETLKVNTKPMRVVPDATAKHMNVKYSLWDQIQNLVSNDLETCRKFEAMPKAAFGKTFQNHFKMETKANDFKTRWHSYSQHHGHHQDLETFAAVWKNITHLQTTRKFCMWLANNPNVAPPPFLENEGLLRENLSFDYSATSEPIYDEYVAPTEIIAKSFRPTRQLATDFSFTSFSESSTSLSSVDISDINIIV